MIFRSALFALVCIVGGIGVLFGVLCGTSALFGIPEKPTAATWAPRAESPPPELPLVALKEPAKDWKKFDTVQPETKLEFSPLPITNGCTEPVEHVEVNERGAIKIYKCGKWLMSVDSSDAKYTSIYFAEGVRVDEATLTFFELVAQHKIKLEVVK